MTTDQSRTEFEAWVETPLGTAGIAGQRNGCIQLCWEAWQESRKGMVPREVADRLRNALMSVRPYGRNAAKIVDAALDATKP